MGMCAIITVGFFAVWVTLSPWRNSCPAVTATVAAAPVPAPPAPPSFDLAEVHECDKAVSALLNSPDVAEITRAGIIIQSLNCGIGKRL